MDKRAQEILDFWFGRIENTVLPSQNRTNIWFGGGEQVDTEIREKFGEDLDKAILGERKDWENEPRGSLALIIVFDQFSRNIHRGMPMAFTQDQKALDLCIRGIERQYDHEVSLIERAFFYMPLMHSESLEMQTTSVRAFKMLVDLSFPEARPLFQNFFEYSLKHYEVVEKFGRFPTRNSILGRESTKEELEYIEKNGNEFSGEQQK